ncbi:MAG: V-type ATP synthase subunit D [Candidatus Aenigmarchaeota archaeon]|nr:V-type ATP synthase subunit D [Candidatus Aenigmarchaeota archaeon]
MQTVKPSRSELLNLKSRLKLAFSGYSVLKKKRDSLIREFFLLLKGISYSSAELEGKYKQAIGAINVARAIEGTQFVRAVSFAPKKKIDLDVRSRRIMNVAVPVITFDKSGQQFHDRGYGLIGTSGYIDDAYESYEDVIRKVLEIAEVEIAMRKLLVEIDKTKRKVNSLEYKIIPEIEESIKEVRQRLEEMERENLFRLKRLKSKKEKQAAS